MFLNLELYDRAVGSRSAAVDFTLYLGAGLSLLSRDAFARVDIGCETLFDVTIRSRFSFEDGSTLRTRAARGSHVLSERRCGVSLSLDVLQEHPRATLRQPHICVPIDAAHLGSCQLG